MFDDAISRLLIGAFLAALAVLAAGCAGVGLTGSTDLTVGQSTYHVTVTPFEFKASTAAIPTTNPALPLP